jgi:hypothetical protein
MKGGIVQVLTGLAVVAVILSAPARSEAAGRLDVNGTNNDTRTQCSFTVFVSSASSGPIGGKAPGTQYMTGGCGLAVEVLAGLYDVKVVYPIAWDQPEKWIRKVQVTDGATQNVSGAFETGFMNFTFACTPCRAEIHKAGDAAVFLTSGCGGGSREISTGTYDIRFQLGAHLVLDCHNTRNVLPALLRRESIDFPGFPLSRV